MNLRTAQYLPHDLIKLINKQTKVQLFCFSLLSSPYHDILHYLLDTPTHTKNINCRYLLLVIKSRKNSPTVPGILQMKGLSFQQLRTSIRHYSFQRLLLPLTQLPEEEEVRC